MISIYPSQIVEFIDTLFKPHLFTQDEFALGATGSVAMVAGLLDLVDRVPTYLITLDRDDAAHLFVSLAAIRSALHRAQTMEIQERQQSGIPPITPISPERENPIWIVHKSFAKCADEAPHPTTPDLPFLEDDELRVSMRSDLDQARRALENGQWKSSIVMSGVVLESLLLWTLRNQWSPTIAKCASCRKKLLPLEEWHLPDYIAVASCAKLISDEIRKQCELCQEFRNLIHPGREIRLQQRPTRGRALGALAAVELVIESITR